MSAPFLRVPNGGFMITVSNTWRDARAAGGATASARIEICAGTAPALGRAASAGRGERARLPQREVCDAPSDKLLVHVLEALDVLGGDFESVLVDVEAGLRRRGDGLDAGRAGAAGTGEVRGRRAACTPPTLRPSEWRRFQARRARSRGRGQPAERRGSQPGCRRGMRVQEVQSSCLVLNVASAVRCVHNTCR